MLPHKLLCLLMLVLVYDQEALAQNETTTLASTTEEVKKKAPAITSAVTVVVSFFVVEGIISLLIFGLRTYKGTSNSAHHENMPLPTTKPGYPYNSVAPASPIPMVVHGGDETGRASTSVSEDPPHFATSYERKPNESKKLNKM